MASLHSPTPDVGGDAAADAGTAVVWRPDAATVEGANLTRFMRALGVDGFDALNAFADRDPAAFHDALIRERKIVAE
jgi:hypothetical protein